MNENAVYPKKKMIEFNGKHFEVRRKVQYDPVNEDDYSIILYDIENDEEVSMEFYFI